MLAQILFMVKCIVLYYYYYDKICKDKKLL